MSDQNQPAQQNVTKCSALNFQSSDLALSPRQIRAIFLMLAGQTDSSIAQDLGVARGTIWRWRTRHPAFIAQLNSRRREHWQAASNRAITLLDRAIDTLEKELLSPQLPDRFRAARLMFQVVGKRLVPTADEPLEPAQVLKQLAQSGIDPAELLVGDPPDKPDNFQPVNNLPRPVPSKLPNAA